MSAKKDTLPEELRMRFNSHIASRTGLYFKGYDMADLDGAITGRMASCGMDSALSYYTYLTMSDKKEDELRELLNRLTVNHTYFFRNEAHFKALRDKVLPELLQRKRAGSHGRGNDRPAIRVWSAGCSTGEEPYSIAMTIRDAVPDIENWDISIIATDASTEALEKAKRGLFTKNSVKNISRETLEKYFTRDESKTGTILHRINNDIKNMVSFSFHNLMEDPFPSDIDIIFCRNVVIYFEFQTTVDIMNRFHSSLSEDGYMFIGYSESLYFMQNKFSMVVYDDAIYYIRTDPDTDTTKNRQELIPSRQKTINEILEEISRSELLAELEEENKKAAELPKQVEEVLIQAMKSFYMKDYNRAMALAEQAASLDRHSVDPHYLAAEINVNRGRLTEAKANISHVLKLNSLFAPAHYLLGCILIEEQKPQKAKESLKRAIYIDKDFPLAHFYLAHLYKNEGENTPAIREYRNTIKILSKKAMNEVIAYSGGFSTATVMDACRDNIERLKFES